MQGSIILTIHWPLPPAYNVSNLRKVRRELQFRLLDPVWGSVGRIAQLPLQRQEVRPGHDTVKNPYNVDTLKSGHLSIQSTPSTLEVSIFGSSTVIAIAHFAMYIIEVDD